MRRLVLGLVLLAAVGLVVWAFLARSGRDGEEGPPVVPAGASGDAPTVPR